MEGKCMYCVYTTVCIYLFVSIWYGDVCIYGYNGMVCLHLYVCTLILNEKRERERERERERDAMTHHQYSDQHAQSHSYVHLHLLTLRMSTGVDKVWTIWHHICSLIGQWPAKVTKLQLLQSLSIVRYYIIVAWADRKPLKPLHMYTYCMGGSSIGAQGARAPSPLAGHVHKLLYHCTGICWVIICRVESLIILTYLMHFTS